MLKYIINLFFKHKKQRKSNSLLDQRGIAIFEVLPLLIVFVVLVGVTIGLWGAIHSGVLQSIAARHYAFEVLNNRTHFEWHRDYDASESSDTVMKGKQDGGQEVLTEFHLGDHMRFFAIISEDNQSENPEPFVTNRGINFFKEVSRTSSQDPSGLIKPYKAQSSEADFHREIWVKKDVEAVNPLWLMVGYGICLDIDCGEPKQGR